MKRVMIPLLAAIALLSGCKHGVVRHAVHVPVPVPVVVEHRHVQGDVVIVHRHEEGRRDHHHDARYPGPRSSRVVVVPAPVVKPRPPVVIRAGDGDRHRDHHTPRGHKPPGLEVVTSPVIREQRIIVKEGDEPRRRGHQGSHEQRRDKDRGRHQQREVVVSKGSSRHEGHDRRSPRAEEVAGTRDGKGKVGKKRVQKVISKAEARGKPVREVKRKTVKQKTVKVQAKKGGKKHSDEGEESEDNGREERRRER